MRTAIVFVAWLPAGAACAQADGEADRRYLLKTSVAYCAKVKDDPVARRVDWLPRGSPPEEWRCLHSALWVCLDGADGIACSRRISSTTPTEAMNKECSAPDATAPSCASGACSYTRRWACRGGVAVIDQAFPPFPLDEQGYSPNEWRPLTVPR